MWGVLAVLYLWITALELPSWDNKVSMVLGLLGEEGIELWGWLAVSRRWMLACDRYRTWERSGEGREVRRRWADGRTTVASRRKSISSKREVIRMGLLYPALLSMFALEVVGPWFKRWR